MRQLVAAALLAIATAAVAGEEPKQFERPKRGEAVCDRVSRICSINADDLALQQATLAAALDTVRKLREALAAEMARKEKRCAVVVPQREASIR